MLSRLVITFLPRSKRLLISWLQLPSAVILEPPKIKSATVSIVSPCISRVVMGPDVMILVFWTLSFKSTFSLSSFTFIKRLFSSFSLYVKKTEHRRIDAFGLWCWRRHLRVPWTAGRSNQSILKEISPGCSLEGLMLKLKLQYFGHLMRRVDSLEKTLMLGKIEGKRRRGDDRGWEGWMASLTQWTWVWVNFGRWWWTGWPGMLQSMGLQRIGHDWETELNCLSAVL